MIASTPRIGVGIVGLSADRGWAAKAHVPALAMVADYELRGLVASRVESANAAASKHGVAFATERVEDLLARRDIGLVVVSVRVPDHRRVVEAALKAGKAVLCEWPLARDLAEAEALAAVAQLAPQPCFVDLQARSSPAVRFIADLVGQGYVGRPLSTSVIAAAGPPWGRETVAQSEVMYQARENGATMLSIPVAHMLDTLSSLFGTLEQPKATLAVQRSAIRLHDSSETIHVTAPDQVCVSGRFGNGVVAALHYRALVCCGTRFRWEINGTSGDILVQGPSAHLQFGRLSIRGATAGSKELTDLSIPDAYWPLEAERASVAYNVGLVYRDIARDLRTGSRLAPTIADALELHRGLQKIEASA
jgi:predicted dehydrogenase